MQTWTGLPVPTHPHELVNRPFLRFPVRGKLETIRKQTLQHRPCRIDVGGCRRRGRTRPGNDVESRGERPFRRLELEVLDLIREENQQAQRIVHGSERPAWLDRDRTVVGIHHRCVIGPDGRYVERYGLLCSWKCGTGQHGGSGEKRKGSAHHRSFRALNRSIRMKATRLASPVMPSRTAKVAGVGCSHPATSMRARAIARPINTVPQRSGARRRACWSFSSMARINSWELLELASFPRTRASIQTLITQAMMASARSGPASEAMVTKSAKVMVLDQ